MAEEKNKQIFPAVVLAQHGNKNACRDIYINYYRNVYFICIEMTESHSKSIDLTTDIFIKMFDSVAKLEDYTMFEQWFYSLAVNMCRPFVPDNDNDRALINSDTAELAQAATKEAANGNSEEFENCVISVIENMVTTLPSEIRVFFMYRYFVGIDSDSIALLESISVAEAEEKCRAVDALINKKAEKIKEQGLDISKFIDNMENTLLHISHRKIVPTSIHAAVSEHLGVDVNPFAPSPAEKDQMEQDAKDAIRKSSGDKKKVKKKFFSKTDLILFLIVLIAGLAIFAVVKYRSSSSDSPTSVTASSTAAKQSATAIAWNGAADVTFAGGDGTSESPYQISTAGQLAYLANLINSNNSEYLYSSYILTADILLNDTDDFNSWSQTPPDNTWTPIGYSNSDADHGYFMGTFDGNGHTITGLYISSSDDYQGLFGVIRNGTVKNLNVEYSYVSGGSCTGGIVGYFVSDSGESEIELCSFSGVIDSSSDNAGGIAGYLRCEGDDTEIIVSCCCSTGSVVAGRYSGGIVGVSESASGTILIENSYNVASVSSSDSVAGGIVGVQRVSNGNSQVKYCYSIGDISGDMSGAIAGECSCVTGTGLSEVASCYWLADSAFVAFNNGSDDSDRLLSSDITELEEQEMRDEEYLSALDFTRIWELSDENDYPYPVLKDMDWVMSSVEESSSV